jgi:HAAS
MMNRSERDPAVDRYLDRVRVSLRGVSEPEIKDILLELRGHIIERLQAQKDAESVLRSLGDPEELARQYRTESVTAKAECGSSPIVILHSLMLLRRNSSLGWAVLALTGFGYAWAFVLGAAAIEKLLSPHDVGLWYRPGSVSLPRIMVDGAGPPGTRELLGWWFVLFGLAACGLLIVLTRYFALWWIRRLRPERGLPTV